MLFFTIRSVSWAANSCECQSSFSSQGDSPNYPIHFQISTGQSSTHAPNLSLDVTLSARHFLILHTGLNSPCSMYSHNIPNIRHIFPCLDIFTVILWVLRGWILCFVHHCILVTLSQTVKKKSFCITLCWVGLQFNLWISCLPWQMWPNSSRKCWLII